MKKTIICTFSLLLSAVFCVAAQDEWQDTPRVEGNHSVSINIVGLHYAYECPLGKNVSIIGRAGLNGGSGLYAVFAGAPFELHVMPEIDIEPRFYYNLDRRARHDRSTSKNTASFISLKMKYFVPYELTQLDISSSWGSLLIAPTWGFRHVWSRHWMLEATAGVDFYFTSARCFDFLPSINLRLGYVF